MANYNPQRKVATNLKANVQANDGYLDEENSQGKPAGILDLQGSGKLNTSLKQPSTKKNSMVKSTKIPAKPAVRMPRTVPAKSVGGAGGGFLGAGSKLPDSYFNGMGKGKKK